MIYLKMPLKFSFFNLYLSNKNCVWNWSSTYNISSLTSFEYSSAQLSNPIPKEFIGKSGFLQAEKQVFELIPHMCFPVWMCKRLETLTFQNIFYSHIAIDCIFYVPDNFILLNLHDKKDFTLYINISFL